MNTFLNGLKDATNFTYTENGAVTHKSTRSKLLDMFALGGAYRGRSDEDCILLFKEAFKENPLYAIRCLFYLRDVRGGQGERRFFRVCLKWLANSYTDLVINYIEQIPEFGRWDDLYALFGTHAEDAALALIKAQVALDAQCKTPSLLGKWLKSENASSRETKLLAIKTRKALNMTAKEYRKMLSALRQRINIVERLMSEKRWDEIEFDKIPSRAGMIYKNAFARHDIERMKSEKQVISYSDFAKDSTTKVNAKTLYPYECVEQVLKMGWSHGWHRSYVALDDINRLMVNKYWDNLADYFNSKPFSGMVIADTSGSMAGYPLNVAISLGLYCAEKAQGPFHGYFMTFSQKPNLIEVSGVDFCQKVMNMSRADWDGNTNVEAAFDLLLNTALQNHCSQDEVPQNLVIVSDMEFDSCVTSNNYRHGWDCCGVPKTLFEQIETKWNAHGYKMPHLIFWNVFARQNNIPMLGNGPVSYVSGFSPVIFETLLSGKTGYELMMEKLNSERYAVIK